jgi:hypothetical protein
LFDYESGALAFYPVVCHQYSRTFECEYGIAFDARTREPHVIRAHCNGLAAPEPLHATASSGGLRSLVRRFLGGGESV